MDTLAVPICTTSTTISPPAVNRTMLRTTWVERRRPRDPGTRSGDHGRHRRAHRRPGTTATKTFTLTVDPANPLVVTNGTSQLTDGTVGVAYEIGLFAGGGVSQYTWSHVAGTLPPGPFVQASPGRVKGTPTAAGIFTFTVRVADAAGQSTTQQFTIRVLA